MTASKRFLDNALRVEAGRREQEFAAEVKRLREIREKSEAGVNDAQILRWIAEGFSDAVMAARERLIG